MNVISKIMTVTTAALVSLVAAPAVQAQSFQHIDRLAVRLEYQVREFHEEVDAHFRASPLYVHLDRDAVAMERQAAHIHEVIHHGASVWHLRRDVRELDQLYHHVQGLVEQLARFGQLDPQAYFHLRQSLARVGETLHHLQEDIDEIGHHHSHYYRPYYRPF